MRSVSPSNPLFQPGDLDPGGVSSAVWGRARDWLGGGRFWSAMIVLLLTIAVSKSTATVQWVPGIDVVVPIAILAAVLMSIFALLPIPDAVGLGVGGVAGLVAAVVGAWPKMHASHPSDVLGPQLISAWWSRIQDGSASQDPSFYLLLICVLMRSEERRV